MELQQQRASGMAGCMRMATAATATPPQRASAKGGSPSPCLQTERESQTAPRTRRDAWKDGRMRASHRAQTGTAPEWRRTQVNPEGIHEWKLSLNCHASRTLIEGSWTCDCIGGCMISQLYTVHMGHCALMRMFVGLEWGGLIRRTRGG